MDDHPSFCKYCGKPLEEFDCTTLTTSGRIKGGWKVFDFLIKLWLLLESPLMRLWVYVIQKTQDNDLEKSGKIKTCVNVDCIEYLKGCYGKRGFYS